MFGLSVWVIDVRCYIVYYILYYYITLLYYIIIYYIITIIISYTILFYIPSSSSLLLLSHLSFCSSLQSFPIFPLSPSSSFSSSLPSQSISFLFLPFQSSPYPLFLLSHPHSKYTCRCLLLGTYISSSDPLPLSIFHRDSDPAQTNGVDG